MSLSVISERRRRRGEVPEDGRKANVPPVSKKGGKEDPGNRGPVGLTSVPGKVMERLVPDVVSKHVQEREVTGSGRHGFTKGESRPPDLAAFSDLLSGWRDAGRAAGVIPLDFRRAFDPGSRGNCGSVGETRGR